MTSGIVADEDSVRTLAAAAGLRLPAGREKIVAPLLNTWLLDANELSRKMSRREYLALPPATVFLHSLR